MPNPSTYFAGRFTTLAPLACTVDLTPPSFAGISGLSQNLDASLAASWGAGSDVSPPIRYEVYVQAGSATGLFSTANIQQITYNLSARIFTDAAGLVLQIGQTYFVGVRAVDAVGNRNTNTVSMSLTITNANYNSLAGAVWDQARASHTGATTFGGALQSKVDVDVSTRLAAASYVAPDNADIVAIKAKTDNLPADPSSESALEAKLAEIKNLTIAGL